MRSPGENMRLWDLNWEIESSGRNAHLMHKCIVNNIATRVFCGFYLGFLAWRAVVQGRGRAGTAQQCQEDDVINQTCNLFALADSFYCKGCSSMIPSKRVQRVVTCIHHTGKSTKGWLAFHFALRLLVAQFSKAMKGDIQQRAQQPSVMHGKVKLPRCRGVKAGGSQQTRLNKWDVF